MSLDPKMLSHCLAFRSECLSIGTHAGLRRSLCTACLLLASYSLIPPGLPRPVSRMLWALLSLCSIATGIKKQLCLIFTLWQLVKEDFVIRILWNKCFFPVNIQNSEWPKGDFSSGVGNSSDQWIVPVAQNTRTCYLFVSTVCPPVTYLVARLTFLLSSGGNYITRFLYIWSLEFLLLTIREKKSYSLRFLAYRILSSLWLS